jgi:hypothetical protein
MLEENHINRLPVMITPDSKLIVGVPDIKALIEKNTNQVAVKPAKGGGIKQPRRQKQPDGDVENYLLNEITSGITYDNKGRAIIPPEKEADDEDHFDYTKERKKYVAPKHHRNLTEEDEEDEPPAPKKTGNTPNRNNTRRPPPPPMDDEEEDDVEDDDVHSQMLNILLND